MFYAYGAITLIARLPNLFCFIRHCHWPDPRSLATTCGVSIDVLSCRYLDVSVPCVRFLPLCIQGKIPFNNTWKPVLFCFVLTLSRLRRFAPDGTAKRGRRALALAKLRFDPFPIISQG